MTDLMEGHFTDEEFYLSVSKTLNELIYTDNFSISLEEKKKLYYEIYISMINHEESNLRQKGYDLEHVKQVYNEFGKSLAELVDSTKKLIEKNEGLHLTKINLQIAKCKMDETLSQIEYMTEEQKSLERKLTTTQIIRNIFLGDNQDPKRVINIITKGMRNQNGDTR